MNQGPFPLPALPGFFRHTGGLRYYEPLRLPTRPSLSLAGVWLRVPRPHRTGSPVVARMSLHACRRHYPGGTAESCRSCPIARARLDVSGGGLPLGEEESASASNLSRPARRSLTFRPACSRDLCDPLHRRLRRLRYLGRRSDSYRLERPLAGWDLHPLKHPRLARRASSALLVIRVRSRLLGRFDSGGRLSSQPCVTSGPPCAGCPSSRCHGHLSACRG